MYFFGETACCSRSQVDRRSAMKMTEPIVFISYSHSDEREKNKLVSHLGVLQGHGLVSLWSDDVVGPGGDWKTELDKVIAHAKIAVLLITANFLNSEFILQAEVPELLRRHQSDGLVIIPVIAKACAWRAVDWLQSLTVRPQSGHPVWAEGGLHADERLSLIAEEIMEIVKQEANGFPFTEKDSASQRTTDLDSYHRVYKGVTTDERGVDASAKGGPWRILIVEDEPSWQKRLIRILQEINCAVVTAANYEEVKGMLTNFNFDLVSIDLNLDKSTRYADGRELALRIREKFGDDIPIIIVTGTGDLEEQRRAFKEYNVFDFIEKAKLDLEEFQSTVLEAIGGSPS